MGFFKFSGDVQLLGMVASVCGDEVECDLKVLILVFQPSEGVECGINDGLVILSEMRLDGLEIDGHLIISAYALSLQVDASGHSVQERY